MGSDAIHSVHPYPCKFPPQTARAHLNRGAALVLDPFCGSGTTLVEAALSGSAVLGFDCNPIAVLLSRFKLLEVSGDFFDRCDSVLVDLDARGPAWLSSKAALHAFPGRDHWFSDVVQREIAAILAWIETHDCVDVRTWLETSLSAITNRISFQESETRYVRAYRDVQVGTTLALFARKARELLAALRDRGSLSSVPRVVERTDILAGLPVADSTVDLVVTSPPYANTMDYYLYHKQRMNLLGYDFKSTQQQEIGSRWEFSSLKAARTKWDADYHASLSEISRVLKTGATAIIIIGDSQIAGEFIDGAELTTSAAARVGLAASVLQSESLARRSRSFNAAFQRPNKREHVVELVKLAPGSEDRAGTNFPEQRLAGAGAAPMSRR
jgi:site-specific DNA-methyltransferase (cytosine-N4-specific)